MKKLRIATRQSELALAQAQLIGQSLINHHKNIHIEYVGMTTQGDILLDKALYKVGGKGLFVKELEKALLENHADIAVHSMKDVPAELPHGLAISVICQREDPRDALLSEKFDSLSALPNQAVIGTSSLRRSSQLKAYRNDLVIQLLRGNVPSRIKRLNEYDAIILAVAGLHRLNLESKIKQYIPIDICLPAVGQGALAIECRENDLNTLALVECLRDIDTERCVLAERAFNQELGGGCHVPIAAYARLIGQQLHIEGLIGNLQNNTVIRAVCQGLPEDAVVIGKQCAQILIDKGAKEILKKTVYE